MSTLANKIAFVTGASKGIGASIAKHLAQAGATVIVNYATSKAGADKTVADITAAGGTAVAIQGDFSKPEEITRVYAEIKETYGRLDVLVNNAAVYAFGALEDVTPEEFYRQFNLNVLGLLLATKEAVALFGPDGGSVINIGSGVTRITPAQSSIYTATKGAVDAITGVLARELGARNIRVNSLNPGIVETEGTQSAGFIGSEFEKGLVAQTPLGRVGQPQDIASVAVFLASDDSGWLTGEHLIVGGGLR